MELKDLRVGREYRVVHKRKKIIYAKFLGAQEGDIDDPVLLKMEIDTSDGSGCEWIRRVPGAQVTLTNIRPSLVTHIEQAKPRPKKKLRPPEPEPKKESVGDRLKRLIGF